MVLLSAYLGARVAFTTKAGKPISAATANGGGHGNRLHIGNRGGAAKYAHVGGKRRLEAGLAGLALQALNQSLTSKGQSQEYATNDRVRTVSSPQM